MSDKPESVSTAISPAVWASLATAILSVMGVLSVALINANAQRALEREQFESNLILKAISTGDKKQSYDNLRFLVEAHLIREQSDKVSALLQDTSFHFRLPADNLPVPPPSAAHIIDTTPAFSGTMVDEVTSRPLKGVTVVVRGTDRIPNRRYIETMVTGANGEFKLHYPPSAYVFQYSRPGYVGRATTYIAGMRFQGHLSIKMERAGKPIWDRIFN
jgi:hypothetical protein